MKTKDFYFDLPDELIAQTPMHDRDQSRLLRVNRQDGGISHHVFHEIIDDLHAGDCLVINNTRVMPARVFGTKNSGARVEFLLLKELGDGLWETLVKPGKRAQVGARFTFSPGLSADVVGLGEEGTRIVRFEYEGVFQSHLAEIGTMPLPPYIQESLEDQERYQTVYSKVIGSSAAPTAGLHFTEPLLDALRAKGVEILPVTLHVGLGTFRPVKVEDVETHVMHEEYFTVTQETADAINAVKARGNRVIAVGTTSVRTLESCTDENGMVQSGEGNTNIFIYPGYRFKCVDAMVTNFHLPESTLLMLISAFASKPLIMEAYARAIEERYRFFSFGDAMLII